MENKAAGAESRRHRRPATATPLSNVAKRATGKPITKASILSAIAARSITATSPALADGAEAPEIVSATGQSDVINMASHPNGATCQQVAGEGSQGEMDKTTTNTRGSSPPRVIVDEAPLERRASAA